MKQKTIYLIVIVCSLSLFSSAKQAGRPECMKHTCCKIKKQETTLPGRVSEKTSASYDLSPLHLFMFSI